MSKKNDNPVAKSTVEQINSTLNSLIIKKLAITCNYVASVNLPDHRTQITWNNHVSGRANSGSYFTKLNQYLHILTNNSYHCLLFDGSLLRVNFEFKNNLLLTQNLLWWPAPFDNEYIEMLAEFAAADIVEDFFEDNDWHKKIKMRSPIRIDFDSSNNTSTHPQSHMHIQHEDTRLNTNEPICFNRFVDFIFRNFYPDYNFSFSEYDYIRYRIPQYRKIEYIASQVNI